jgi:uncharacterized protein YaaQ
MQDPQEKPKTREHKLFPTPRPSVRYLVGVVVQVQDVRQASRAIEELGLPVTQLPSTGAFLGRRNVTLLIGLQEGMEQAVYNAIQETCHQRVEYVSTPIEGAPMPIPLATPITVGGATIFTLEIERYEEI